MIACGRKHSKGRGERVYSRDEVNLHTIESSGDHLRLLERKRTAAAKAASIEIRQNDHCKCALACARTDLRLRPVAVGAERAPNLETGAAGRAAATATPAAKSMTFMTMVIFLGSYTDFRGRGHLWWLHLSSAATWHKVQGVKIAVNSVILHSKSEIPYGTSIYFNTSPAFPFLESQSPSLLLCKASLRARVRGLRSSCPLHRRQRLRS